jgi:hypothetical protein
MAVPIVHKHIQSAECRDGLFDRSFHGDGICASWIAIAIRITDL